MLDEIHLEILEAVAKNPKRPLANAIKPLLEKRKELTLYDRTRALEVQQFITVDRSQKRVALAEITEKGRAAIIGREKPTSEEVRSP
jgi:hypothetical protein